MSKIKDFLISCKDKIKEYFANIDVERSNRFAKIVSFFTGLIFNIFGVMMVAFWKYVFCSDERKSKYCVRLSIFGVIVKIIILIKMVQFSFYQFISSPFYFFEYHKPNSKVQQYAFIDDDFIDFDDIFDKNIKSFNKMRRDFYREFNESFDKEFERMRKDKEKMKEEIKKRIDEQEKVNFNEDNGKIIKEKKDGVNITKSLKEKDGYKEEIVLKEYPNGYEKTITKSYNNFDKNKKLKKETHRFNGKDNSGKKIKKNNKKKQ